MIAVAPVDRAALASPAKSKNHGVSTVLTLVAVVITALVFASPLLVAGLIDVLNKVRENFAKNSETVTKKFYDEFKKEHVRFMTYIKGIDEDNSRVRAVRCCGSCRLNSLSFVPPDISYNIDYCFILSRHKPAAEYNS